MCPGGIKSSYNVTKNQKIEIRSKKKHNYLKAQTQRKTVVCVRCFCSDI